jgi:hypothetical protein
MKNAIVRMVYGMIISISGTATMRPHFLDFCETQKQFSNR